jgi:hypothetical protein
MRAVVRVKLIASKIEASEKRPQGVWAAVVVDQMNKP